MTQMEQPNVDRHSDVNLRRSEVMNNFFRAATKVIEEDDVQNFIRDLVDTKFRLREREWILKGSTDGINVYVDNRNAQLDGSSDTVSRSELREIIDQNNKAIDEAMHQDGGDVVSTCLRAMTVILACLNSPNLKFIAPPLFNLYTWIVYLFIGGKAEED